MVAGPSYSSHLRRHLPRHTLLLVGRDSSLVSVSGQARVWLNHRQDSRTSGRDVKAAGRVAPEFATANDPGMSHHGRNTGSGRAIRVKRNDGRPRRLRQL